MHKKQVTKRDLRIFGLIWGLIFSIIAYKFPTFAVVISIVSVCFIFSAIAYPDIYERIKFYQIWIKFGDLMGKINGFIISFILFYGIFVPTAIILKILRKDLLSKKLNPAVKSYFVDRNIQPGDMKNQF